jgi:hypothetical protein
MRLRLTIRRGLVVVAGVALAIAAWRDWDYRARRDLWKSREGLCRVQARLHDEERVKCLEQDRKLVPYDTQRDDWSCDGLWKHIGSPHPYMSWQDEAKDNAAAASQLHKMADQAAAMKYEAERHLIFP